MTLNFETTKGHIFFLDCIWHPGVLIYNKRNEAIRNWCQPREWTQAESTANGRLLWSQVVCVCVCLCLYLCMQVRTHMQYIGGLKLCL